VLEKECNPDKFCFSLAKNIYYDNRLVAGLYYRMEISDNGSFNQTSNEFHIAGPTSILGNNHGNASKKHRLLFQNNRILVREDLIKQLMANKFTGLHFIQTRGIINYHF